MFKTLYSSIRMYGLNSMFLRNAVRMLTFTLLPVIIAFIWIFSYGGSIYDDNLEKANLQTLYRAQAMLDMFISEVVIFSEKLYTSKDVIQLANRVQEKYPSYDNLKMRYNIVDLISYQKGDYVQNVYIYSALNDHLITSGSAGPPAFYDDTLWINAFYDNYVGNNLAFFALSLVKDTDKKQLYYYKPLQRDPDGSQGFIAVSFYYEKLDRLLFDKNKASGQDLVAIDENGLVLYANNPSWISRNIDDLLPGLNYGANTSAKGQKIREPGGEGFICNVVFSDICEWKYISVLPDSVFREARSVFYIAVALMFLTCIVFAMICTMLISIEAFEPISLIREMLDDPLRIAPEKMRDNELKQIVGTIYKTHGSESVKKDEVEKHMGLLNAARIRALQAQINPHFLYNTLQAINIVFEKETGNSDSQSVELIEQLSSLIRDSSQVTQNIVPLAEEIRYIEKYLNIQKTRFGDSFTIEFDIPEKTRSFFVPKMSLQPIVENVFKHGSGLKSNSGLIRLKAGIDSKYLYIEIYDNGDGIGESRINQINEMFSSELQFKDTHIGLNNVNARLRLIYGADAGLKLVPADCGLTVIMKVPIDLP